MCRVQYAPGKQVSWHKHDDTEQLMFIIEGEVEMTIEEETAPLGPGDVVVVNRGLHHKLYSENGVVFIEALAPVPLDHVPDRDLDLVLGPDGGVTHVER
jgi:mannose-6-phosphate isomerase-like protein (cupin superfamily)